MLASFMFIFIISQLDSGDLPHFSSLHLEVDVWHMGIEAFQVYYLPKSFYLSITSFSSGGIGISLKGLSFI